MPIVGAWHESLVLPSLERQPLPSALLQLQREGLHDCATAVMRREGLTRLPCKSCLVALLLKVFVDGQGERGGA